ncbi:MAG: hypothetical protein O7A04_06815, partial [Acidobacteria bacterium]|nr:hypothetical protein [Acidobacteriota bacterium]
MRLWKPLRFGRPGQDDYLWRLNLIRLAGCSVKLHRFLRSDLDECLHDHPWPFASLILRGGYFEVTTIGMRWHPAGSWLLRPAEHRH